MTPFLQALLSAKTARLVLDYLKVLAWPIVLLSALIFFSPQLRTLLGKINSGTVGLNGFSWSSGTGESPSSPVSPAKSPRPDVSFRIGPKPADGVISCAERAKKALAGSGFSPNQNGDMTWGYQDEKLVGAVWCAAPNNSVLITVAGAPVSELEAKLTEIENRFFNAG